MIGIRTKLSVLLLLVLALPAILLPVSRLASAASTVSPDGWGVVNIRPANEWVCAMWGTSSTNVIAVGAYGTILHYDGLTWSPMTSGTTNILRSVWGSSSSDVYAVGDYGTILHYNGSAWNDESLPGPGAPSLFGVWGSSSTNVFFVGLDGSGTGGAILHYYVDGGGATWDWRTVGTDALFSVWGSSASDVYAVGDNGTMLHFDGSTWSSIDTATAVMLLGVWGSSSSDVFAVGDYGTIVHYNTSTGVSLGSYGSDLWGIWGSSLYDIYAVGEGGFILHFNGGTWAPMDSGTDYDLSGVWGYYPGYDVYIAGAEGFTKHGLILHYPSPTISAVNPNQGTQGQTLDVTITGTNLAGVTAVSDVSFGAGITVNSLPSVLPTELTVNVTVGLYAGLGLRDVSVSDSGDTYTLASAFEVAAPPPPTVDSLNPSQGAQGQTLDVTINGTNLAGTTTLSFGEGITINGSVSVVSPTQIAANISIGGTAALGARDVSVTTPGGTVTKANGFTVGAPTPTIGTVSPESGLQGQSFSVTITGTGFTGATAVSFGAGITVGSHTVNSASQITVPIVIGGDAAVGPRDVSVTTPGGTVTKANGFTVGAPTPTIGTVSPENGLQGQSFSVTITGTGFTGATAVSFGAGITVGSHTVNSASQITVPIVISGDAAVGPRDVSVTTPGGTSTDGTAAFTVDQAPPSQAQSPTITSVNPNQGTPGQTLDVTITGADLTGVTAMSFGLGITVNTISGRSPTELIANITITSGAASGARDVSITSPSGGSLPGGFTVLSSSQGEGQTDQQDTVDPANDSRGIPIWIWVLIGIAAVLLGAVVLVLALLRRAPARR